MQILLLVINYACRDNSVPYMYLLLYEFMIVIVMLFFFLLDKGHEAENLKKECLFLSYYHFPMDDSSDCFLYGFLTITLSN